MLSAAVLLDVWERAWAQPPLQRALLLLRAADPARPPEELAVLPVGRCDALLLDLREAAFGPRLQSVTACPACGEALEFSCEVSDLRVTAEDPPETLATRVEDCEAAFRLPSTRDLLVLAADGNGPADGRALLGLCLLSASRGGEALAPAEIPDELAGAIARRMEEADPQANTRVALGCAECGHCWESPFDIVSYLWAEVDAWARRTIAEVHALASAYGWSEAEILRLSARRRQLYLEMSR